MVARPAARLRRRAGSPRRRAGSCTGRHRHRIRHPRAGHRRQPHFLDRRLCARRGAAVPLRRQVGDRPVAARRLAGVAGGHAVHRTRPAPRGRGDQPHAARASCSAAKRWRLFPEGTTTDGTTLLPFHSNLLAPAMDVRAPLWPVALRYTERGRFSDRGRLRRRQDAAAIAVGHADCRCRWSSSSPSCRRSTSTKPRRAMRLPMRRMARSPRSCRRSRDDERGVRSERGQVLPFAWPGKRQDLTLRADPYAQSTCTRRRDGQCMAVELAAPDAAAVEAHDVLAQHQAERRPVAEDDRRLARRAAPGGRTRAYGRPAWPSCRPWCSRSIAPSAATKRTRVSALITQRQRSAPRSVSLQRDGSLPYIVARKVLCSRRAQLDLDLRGKLQRQLARPRRQHPGVHEQRTTRGDRQRAVAHPRRAVRRDPAPRGSAPACRRRAPAGCRRRPPAGAGRDCRAAPGRARTRTVRARGAASRANGRRG